MQIYNVEWDVDADEIFERLDNMDVADQAEALSYPLDRYQEMTTDERHDYAYDTFHHRPGVLDEFLGLPEIIDVPDEVAAEGIDGVTDWLSDTYGYCFKGFSIVGESEA